MKLITCVIQSYEVEDLKKETLRAIQIQKQAAYI